MNDKRPIVLVIDDSYSPEQVAGILQKVLQAAPKPEPEPANQQENTPHPKPAPENIPGFPHPAGESLADLMTKGGTVVRLRGIELPAWLSSVVAKQPFGFSAHVVTYPKGVAVEDSEVYQGSGASPVEAVGGALVNALLAFRKT